MTDSAIETMLNCIDEVPAVKAAFDGMDEAEGETNAPD